MVYSGLIQQKLKAAIERVGAKGSRYNMVWLVMPTDDVGTSLQYLHGLCDESGWRFFDYTSDPGNGDCLPLEVDSFTPDDLHRQLRSVCRADETPVVVVNLEPAFALWSNEQVRGLIAVLTTDEQWLTTLCPATFFFSVAEIEQQLLAHPRKITGHIFDMANGELL